MIRKSSPFLTASILGLSTLAAIAGDKWPNMDYGRFLSASYQNTNGKTTLEGPKAGCATNKGIAVKLGSNGEASQLFDTELVRMAGGWTGGWVERRGVTFDGGHGGNPKPANGANLFFQTNPGPTWSKGDDLKDPRKISSGPGAATIPLGPLPKEWAKYRGLYLHGDNVVFAYTVGEASLLEMPALEKAGDVALLTRTFNVLTSGAPSTLVLSDAPEGAVATLEGEVAISPNDAKNPDMRTVIGLVGAPAGAKLQAEGNRVTLKLPAFTKASAFKVVYAKGPSADAAALTAAIKAAPKAADLAPFTKGGPGHWKETVKVKGVLGQPNPNFPYVVDDLQVPLENPYKSGIRIGGLDFFKDGRVAFCTWNGDVWIGKGIDSDLASIEWQRYATGLFQALGLKIVDDQVYVLGRDQITRLHDVNSDGEADLYENFNNDFQVTPAFHEFAFGLDVDSQGNFYSAKGGPVKQGGRGWEPLSDHSGCIFKISKDGQKFEIFATGVRAPNGIGMGPNDEVSNGDNEGTWVPADYIHISKQGDFIEVPDLAHKPTPPTAPGAHICWIPKDMCNSNGGQVWVTSDKWGPLKGQMLYLSYGQSSLFSVLQERVGEIPQGGVVRFPLTFASGLSRARFNPVDGQLYVSGLKGWQTNAARDGAIQRVRYTGGTLTMQNSIHFTDKGIRIDFTSPLDSTTAAEAANYSVIQYNYLWSSNYGSDKYKVSAANQKGTEPLPVTAVTLSPDKKSVFLEIAGLKPVMQIEVKMNIKTAAGTPVPERIAATINTVAPDSTPGKTYLSIKK